MDNPDEAIGIASSFFHSLINEMKQQISSQQTVATEGVSHNYVCESTVIDNTIKDLCGELEKEKVPLPVLNDYILPCVFKCPYIVLTFIPFMRYVSLICYILMMCLLQYMIYLLQSSIYKCL